MERLLQQTLRTTIKRWITSGNVTLQNCLFYFFKNEFLIYRKKYTSPAFLVFGDDLDWIRQNLIGQDIFYTGNI